MPTIPAWVPPIPSRTTLNNQNNVNESLKTILAEGSPAPIILGRAQVGGKIFAVDYDSSSSPGVFTVGVLWAVGENNSIVNVYANGAAFSGLNRNDYPGRTTQTADSLLSSAITGYSDTLVLNKNGTDVPFCYSVLQWNDTHYSSFPDFVAEIEGLRTNGGAYSNSPARAVEYLIEHAALGPNATADSTSFSAVATDNAATVTTESRRTIGLVVDRTQRFDDWLKVAAVYMSAWITKKGDTYYAVSDRPASSVATLTTDDWEQGSFGLQIPDRDNQPTVVEVTFTDTSSTIWRDRVARAEVNGVSTGTVKERISRVRMPGVTRYTQARREAVERLNKLYNGGMTISFDAFDDQIVREVGDVITVTRGSHLNAVQFRVSQPPVKRLGGGVRIVAMEYLSGAYSDVEPTDPTYNDDAQSLGDGTAGGDWGDIANMPVNLSTLTGTEDIDNSDVNISVSGTTIGLDGGGTTTYTLDQTNVGLSGVQNDADQTSANTAAGIAGQGALATANEVSWTSEVTSRPTELTDGRVSTGLDSDGNLISSVNGTPASIVGQSTGGAWRNGFEDGSEFSGWTAPTGHTLTRETSEVFSGSSSARIVTATQSSSAAGTTGAVYFAIPEEIALSFGGRKILITCYAKAATSSGASSFQIAYSTNEVGNSGFSSFTPTTSWQVFAFTYDVPDPVNGGTDFIGIQGDGSSGVLYVDNVAVMALMNDDEINLSGVPNALQYSGGGTFTGDLASTRNTGALADADTVNLASTGAGGVTGLLPTGNAATGLRNSNVNYASDGTGELPENRGGTGLTSTYTLRNTNVLSDDFSHGSTTQYLSRWTAANDTGGEETIVTDTNSPQGSYVLQIGDNSAGGDDEVWRSLPMADAIPIEENAIYKLRAIAARTAGSGTIYFGINGVNAAKTAWVRRDGSTSSTHMGSAHYIAASGHSPSDTAYHEYVGYFYRNATDGQLHANALNANTNTLDNVARIDHAAEYAVPLFIANYNNAPGTVKIAFIELSKVVGFGADSEIFLNSSITINPNGLIVGAGGGQVTIGGLGYTGDMAATRNTGALADADTVNLATTGAGGVTGLLPTGNAATGLRNSGITINANGSISGAGGGQVTIGGLGYTGHLNATRNTGALADEDTVNLATTGAGGVSGLLPSGNASTGLRNSSISISSNGTLNNAGGGSVNLNGLGFTGDTDATNGAVAGTNFTSGYRPGDTEILASTASTLVNASAGWTQLADSFQLNGSGSVTVEYDRYSQASAINGHAPVQIQFRQGSTVLYTLSSIYGNSTWINNNEVNITLNNVTDPIDVFVRAQQSGQSGGVRNVSIKAGAIANGEAIV